MTHRVRLALIVGAPRSGTTLTRVMLDAHPEIGCPSEAGLPALMAHLAKVWWTVNAEQAPAEMQGDPGARVEVGEPHSPRLEASPKAHVDKSKGQDAPDLPLAMPERAREWIVRTVEEPMAEYCAREGSAIYCDKSLDSVFHLSLVYELFPDARILLLFRHVMDTVVSGIEASPWGFNAYGYAPYVQAWPGNTVAALASYWLDHVEAALSWEKQHPECCHRVRYEDLVRQPEKTVAEIERFVGVSEDLSILRRAFSGEPARGPGDYKVDYTTQVHAAAIGRGKRAPVSLLPPSLLKALNEKLEALGYDVLDHRWNMTERAVDGEGRGMWAQRLTELMGGIRIAHASDVGSFAVVAEDHQALRWVVDPLTGTVQQGDGEVTGVVIGTAADLVLMLTGEENLGVLLRSGRVRHLVGDQEEAARRDVMRDLRVRLALLRRNSRASGTTPIAQAVRRS